MKQVIIAALLAALGVSACSQKTTNVAPMEAPPVVLDAPVMDIEAAPIIERKTTSSNPCATTDGIGGTGCAID